MGLVVYMRTLYHVYMRGIWMDEFAGFLIGWGLLRCGFYDGCLCSCVHEKKTKLPHDCTYIGTLPCFCIFVQGKVVGSCPVKAPSAVLSDINRRSPITLKFISDTNKILCSFTISVAVTDRITVPPEMQSGNQALAAICPKRHSEAMFTITHTHTSFMIQ